jgi:OOP family OmpA-OmpF porin
LSGRTEHGTTTSAPPTPSVTQTIPAAPTPSRLALSNDDGVITYSGTVGNDAARASVTDSLKAVFGAAKLKGDVGVNSNAGAATWIPNLKTALDNVKTPGSQVTFEGNVVNVGGSIPDADRDRIIASLKSVFGSGVVLNTLGDSAIIKTTVALAELKPGFSPKDLAAVLNESSINFQAGSTEVPSTDRPMLQQAASLIKQLPAGTVIQISGYADTTGDPAANTQLSQQRADAVRQLLVDAGVNPAMLVARGHGSAMASTDSATGRSASARRIGFSVAQ